MLGQLVDDLDTRQLIRKWLAFATTLGWRNDLFLSVLDNRHRLAFGLVEQRQLRRVGLNGLFGFSTEYTVTQQLDLFL